MISHSSLLCLVSTAGWCSPGIDFNGEGPLSLLDFAEAVDFCVELRISSFRDFNCISLSRFLDFKLAVAISFIVDWTYLCLANFLV